MALRFDETFGPDPDTAGPICLTVHESRGCDAVTHLAGMPEFIRRVIDSRGIIAPIIGLRMKFG